MSETVPQGWQLKSVGDLSKVKRGASPRPIQDPKWWGGKVGWVRISDVTSSRKYLKKTTQYLSDEGVAKSVKIDKGEVVLSICATIGRPIIVGVDACIHDGFVWFDGLKKSIDREYWYYFLASQEEFLSSQRQSGTQGNLNTSIVSELICPLPPLPEQQKIASILSSVDKVIETTRAQIDKLKDLKTGMMQELLTKGIGHTEFKDSPVGRIPAAWDVFKFDEATIKIQDGTHFSPQTKEGDFLYVTSKNIQNGKLDLRNISYISKEEHEAIYRRCDVKYGDVLLTKDGANTGNCAMNTISQPFSLLSSVAFLRTNEAVCMNMYLYQYISSPTFQRIMKDSMTGNAITRLTLSLIKNFRIPLPSISEQKTITSVLSSIDERVNAVESKLVALNSTKKALMQDLLTGKVRVNVDNNKKEERVAV